MDDNNRGEEKKKNWRKIYEKERKRKVISGKKRKNMRTHLEEKKE